MTIKELAKEIGVSASLVSKALNGYSDVSAEKREYIIEKAKEFGYFPSSAASSLARKKNIKIALLISASENDLFIDEISMIYSIAAFRYINKLGYEPSVIYFDYLKKFTEEQVVNYFKSHDILGVIIFGYSGHQNLEKLMQYHTIKKVILDDIFINESSSTVTIDNKKAQYEICDQMISAPSITKIAYMTGSHFASTGIERFDGFDQFRQEHPEKLFDIYDCDFSESKAYNYIKNSTVKYDAIVCASDIMAVEVSKACFATGKAPLILGFDGIRLINYTPLKIVSIKQDFKKTSQEAVIELIKLINGQEGSKIILDYTLIENNYALNES